MYDDLDPMFSPSAETALDKVAVRVHQLRVRRRVTIGGTLAAVVVVTALSSTAFASSRHPALVAVTNNVTTTTDSATTVPNGATTSTSDVATTTTSAPTDTTPAVGPTDTTTPPTDATTTTLPPPDLHYTLGQSKLVIQSGTQATISYTVTNDGEGPGTVEEPGCPDNELWPDNPPPGWPQPTVGNLRVWCQSLLLVPIGPHETKTFSRTVLAGRWSGAVGIVPAPPGTTSYLQSYNPQLKLPVTITAPAPSPFSSTFPSHITVASGTAYNQTFTLTNRLALPVSYTLVGPCMRLASGGACDALPGAPLDRSWASTFTVGANATVTLLLDMGATSNLEGPGFNNPPLAPGDYQLYGPGGMPVTLTVTP